MTTLPLGGAGEITLDDLGIVKCGKYSEALGHLEKECQELEDVEAAIRLLRNGHMMGWGYLRHTPVVLQYKFEAQRTDDVERLIAEAVELVKAARLMAKKATESGHKAYWFQFKKKRWATEDMADQIRFEYQLLTMVSISLERVKDLMWAQKEKRGT